MWFALVASDRYADGERVELPVETAAEVAGPDAICVAEYGDERRVTALRVSAQGAARVPPIWFVEVRESTGSPPAVNLVAFTAPGVPPGSLLADTDVDATETSSEDQLGAVRWYPATGEIDQIYVQPRWRRRHLGLALVAAAATLSYARDWPRLWSDGQRTELGEQFRNAGPWRQRARDLTNLSPPMTPPTAGAARP